MTYVLCDSSSLISFTGACLEGILYFLHEKHKVRFMVPQSVVNESVNRPLSMKSKIYSFSALRIKDLINDGVVQVTDVEVTEDTKRLLREANKIFFARGKPIHLIDLGETEMLAAAHELEVPNLLMDERTTRMLIEGPPLLRSHLEKELHVNIMVNRENLQKFADYAKGMQVIRSCDAAVIAYENGYFKSFQDMEKEAAEAALYKIKFSGCSISFNELAEYSRGL